MAEGSTPSQTVGPYLAIGLPWPDGPDVVPAGTAGAVTITGGVFDAAGEAVPDAMVETWQADPDGRFDHPDDPRAVEGWRGFGRDATDEQGRWRVRTLVPGAVDGQAPHIDVSVFARGLLHRVVTRIYFPENTVELERDPVLASVPHDRRHTLIASPDGPASYRFDVRLAGPRETVFFAL